MVLISWRMDSHPRISRTVIRWDPPSRLSGRGAATAHSQPGYPQGNEPLSSLGITTFPVWKNAGHVLLLVMIRIFNSIRHGHGVRGGSVTRAANPCFLQHSWWPMIIQRHHDLRTQCRIPRRPTRRWSKSRPLSCGSDAPSRQRRQCRSGDNDEVLASWHGPDSTARQISDMCVGRGVERTMLILNPDFRSARGHVFGHARGAPTRD